MILLLGCLFISDAEHAARLAQGGDSDTAPGDSVDQWSGAYEGSFTLELSGELGPDTCDGTAVLTVDLARSPLVEGTVSCTYDGVYGLSGEQEGTLTGYGDIPDANGTINLETHAGIDDTWAGSFDEGPPHTLSGSFDGEIRVFTRDLTYTGSFLVEKAGE